jgi:hypothetical protein
MSKIDDFIWKVPLDFVNMQTKDKCHLSCQQGNGLVVVVL